MLIHMLYCVLMKGCDEEGKSKGTRERSGGWCEPWGTGFVCSF